MDNNQKQDWWPDMDAKPSDSNPEFQTNAEPQNDYVPSVMDNTTSEPESNINSDPAKGASTQTQEENPYIQYPWNQIPRQQDSSSGYQQNGYQQNPYQQSGYQQNAYQQNPYPGSNSDPRHGNGFATAAMVMGIISLCMTCCGASFIFGALGIIFAILSRKENKIEGPAKTGLILSIVGFVAGIVMVIASLFMLTTSEYQEIFQEYQRFYNEYEDDYDGYEDYEYYEDYDFEGYDFDDIFEDSL